MGKSIPVNPSKQVTPFNKTKPEMSLRDSWNYTTLTNCLFIFLCYHLVLNLMVFSSIFIIGIG